MSHGSLLCALYCKILNLGNSSHSTSAIAGPARYGTDLCLVIFLHRMRYKSSKNYRLFKKMAAVYTVAKKVIAFYLPGLPRTWAMYALGVIPVFFLNSWEKYWGLFPSPTSWATSCILSRPFEASSCLAVLIRMSAR